MCGRPEANSGFGRRWGAFPGKYRILREFSGRLRAGKWRCGAKTVSTRTFRGVDERRDGVRRSGERRAWRSAAAERAQHRAQVVGDDARQGERAGDHGDLVAVVAGGEDVRAPPRVELGSGGRALE